MKMQIVATICLLICLVPCNFEFERPPGSKCKDVKAADVDHDWLVKVATLGMDNTMGTKYSLKHKAHAKPNFQDDFTLTQKFCLSANVKVENYTMPVMLIFKYNKFNEFKIYVRTVDTQTQNSHFMLNADIVIAKTDNRTYILVVGCLVDRHKFWQVHTPKGITLSNKIRSEIFKFLKTQGFRTKWNKNSKSVLLQDVTIANCSLKQVGDRVVKGGGAPPPTPDVVPGVTKVNLLQILLVVLGNILTI